jgi:SAM-dependent methyltransferase
MTDHVRRNREAWTRFAADYVETGRAAWASNEPWWGMFHVPESELHVLPEDLDGTDAVELGCGTGYVSSWLARRGARPVGVDVTAAQLRTARTYQDRFGLRFPLVQADAEAVPLRAGSFDLAISEYGASIWCDPYRWIPEAARLLRPGGELIFLAGSALMIACSPEFDSDAPVTDRLVRDYFGMHRVDWDEGTTEFNLPHGDWVRLLRSTGFDILDLIEVRPPEGATTRYEYVTTEWARRWPVEEIWKARKRG